MSLDFRHTCPEIDNSKENINLEFIELSKELGSILENIKNGRYTVDDILEDVINVVKETYSNVNEEFETLRELNKEMRDVSDKQIDSLNKHISELEDALY